MATDAEANAAGFTTPKNSDLISGGDDAITRNALATLDLVDAAAWDRGTVPSGNDLNNLTKPGFYGYFGSFVANAPTAGSGTLLVAPIRTTSGATSTTVQLAIQPHITSPEMYLRFKGTTGWSAWRRMDAGAVVLPKLPTAMRPAAPGSIKSAPLALTTGHGGSQTTGTGTTVVIQHMPAMVQRVQLHLVNRNPRYQLGDADPTAVSSVAIGLHNGSGGSAAWTSLTGTGSTPWDSAWIDVPEAWRGKDIAVRYTWSSTGTIQRNIGTAWTDGTRDGNPPLWAWLECSVPASTPVVAVFGDSLAAGVGSARPVIDSYIVQWAKSKGAFPALWASSGDASTTWTDDTDRKWFMYGMNVAAPDALIYAMGSNEVYGGAAPTLAVMQQRTRDTVAMIKTKLTPNVIGALIMPRTSYPDETLRRAVNAWYPGSGLFRQVLNFGAAVSTDDDNLTPAYDSDGTHLTTAGYTAVAGAIPRSIVTWPDAEAALRARLDALEYDSGLRTLSKPAGVEGDVLCKRTGPAVEVNVEALRGVTGTITVPDILPVGMRPIRTIRVPLSTGATLNISYGGSITLTGITSATAWNYGQAMFIPSVTKAPATLPGNPA